jgi:hypothetical protein
VTPDDQADRIEAGFSTADEATLSGWVQVLLDDSRDRTAAFLAQTVRLPTSANAVGVPFARCIIGSETLAEKGLVR